VERVDDELVALGEHALAVPDDEETADGSPLAPFQAELAGQRQEALEDGRGHVGGEGVGGHSGRSLLLSAAARIGSAKP